MVRSWWNIFGRNTLHKTFKKNEMETMNHKTEGVKILVQDVLATISEPYTEDITLSVCVKIEHNPEWRRRYEELCDELRSGVVNNSIGTYVKSETGYINLGKSLTRGKSKIIKSYTRLGRAGRR
jgi:hypothetical protein